MADNESKRPPPGKFPPPPPVDPPVLSADTGGSPAPGAVLGFTATALGSFEPLIARSTDSVRLVGSRLIPIVVVAGVGLAIPRSTRRTGIGMLSGSAVGLVVFVGVCVHLLSTGE